MLSDLDISYDGDLIEGVKFKKGLSVRPLWATIKSLEPDQMIMWVDRFDSLCPVASEWALAQALEASAELKITPRVQLVRSVFAEVNRLIYLTTYLGKVVRGLGLMQSFQQIMILRELVYQKQEEITGGRILPQVFCVGGVRRDLAMGDIRKLREFITSWKEGWQQWSELTVMDQLLESRLDGLLKISENQCRKKGFWGIVGKGSGLIYDSRVHQPYGAYAQTEMNLNYNFPLLGDALSRFKVALFEVNQSLSLCEQLLSQASTETVNEKKSFKLKDGIFTGSSESAKGPVTAAIEVKDEKVANLKLFTVGSRVWPQIEEYFVGCRAEEFDLLWASLGMSGEESET